MSSPIGFPADRNQFVVARLLDQLTTRADTRRVEAVTARVADPAAELGGRLREPLEIDRTIADISAYRQVIAISESRAAATQLVIEQMRGIIDDVSSQATVALQNGASNGVETMSALARDALGQAVAGLSSSIGGRAIFAGDRGDRSPLVDADTLRGEIVTLLEAAPNGAAGASAVNAAFTTPGGVFETTLYTGGNGDAPETEIAEGERVAYQARADEPVFRTVLASLGTLSAAYDPNVTLTAEDRRTLAEDALDDLRNAIDPLNRVAARIGSAEARIETVKARYVAEETALTRTFNDLVGADTLTAASELQAVEGQLEILFLTTARISDLSLANFLR